MMDDHIKAKTQGFQTGTKSREDKRAYLLAAICGRTMSDWFLAIDGKYMLTMLSCQNSQPLWHVHA